MFTAPIHLLSRTTLPRVKNFLNPSALPKAGLFCSCLASCFLQMPVPSSQKASFPSTTTLGHWEFCNAPTFCGPSTGLCALCPAPSFVRGQEPVVSLLGRRQEPLGLAGLGSGQPSQVI